MRRGAPVRYSALSTVSRATEGACMGCWSDDDINARITNGREDLTTLRSLYQHAVVAPSAPRESRSQAWSATRATIRPNHAHASYCRSSVQPPLLQRLQQHCRICPNGAAGCSIFRMAKCGLLCRLSPRWARLCFLVFGWSRLATVIRHGERDAGSAGCDWIARAWVQMVERVPDSAFMVGVVSRVVC